MAAREPDITLPPVTIRPFEPGTLWQRIVQRSEQALASGALAPIITEESVLEDGGVRFRVRRVSSLARKAVASAPSSGNPFMPPEAALRVADVCDSHFALLNKYPVLAHHLLIVTRRFEDQEQLLTRRDFEALAACMAEFEALGFYNGGRAAGASQAHKHLQLVPLPLAADGPAVPMEALLDRVTAFEGGGGALTVVPGLPFVHAFARLDPALYEDPARAAAVLHERYHAMLQAAGLSAVVAEAGGPMRQSGPYNLLVTRRWMWLVPRTREHFEDISVNALGFAGSFFVRDARQLERLREHGPMRALRAVAVTRG